MNLYLNSKTITYIFICILIVGCSTSSSIDKKSKFEEEVFIKKPNINSKFNQLPKEINFLISNDSKFQAEILDGLISNYFYYKNNKRYIPKINIGKLNYKQSNYKCLEGINTSKFTFLILNEKNFTIPSKCKNSFQKLNGIQIITQNANRINAPKLYTFEVREGVKEMVNNQAKLNKQVQAIILDQKDSKNLKSLIKGWENTGGNVLESERIYSQNITELIPKSLLIKESNNRRKEIEQTIRTKIQSTPRRRQDAEVIVLSADLDNARSLKPALEYNYGERIPVYLIPFWNNKDKYQKKELDLEGTILIEMPWIAGLNQDFKISTKIPKTRAFAIGYDSYEIFLILSSKAKIEYLGLTGKITINQSEIDRRDLLIKINEGKLIPIGY